MGVENELSEREVEILLLVATGASNKEIATRLVISPNTVKVHLRNIFTKIEVGSRTEATLFAIRSGLIQPDRAIPLISGDGNGETQLAVAGDSRSTWWRLPIMIAAIVILALAAYFIFRPTTIPPDQSGLTAANLPGRWQTLKEMPESGSGMAAVSYEGRIFVIGGTRGGTVSGAVSAYDSGNDSWSENTAKPTPVESSGAVLIGEKIYMPGGQAQNGKPTAVVEIYDPRTDRWETAAPMPKALSRFALAALEGTLFVFGGWDGSAFSDAVYQYDVAEDSWHERGPMPSTRAVSAAAVLGTKIILVGGINADGILSDTWAYFPQREVDGEIAWEKRSDLPASRSGFSLTELAGSLYLAGGLADSAEDAEPLLRYDDTEDRWEVLEPPPNFIGVMPGMAAQGNFVHIFGGVSNDHSQSSHLAYQAIYTVLIPAISR